MLQARAHLCRAIGINTAPNYALVFCVAATATRHLAAALRTSGGKTKRGFIPGAFIQHYIHHRGNDLARFFDSNGIADANVLLQYVIFVVQCRAADGAASQEDRFELRHRRQRSSAAHLHSYSFQPSLCLFRGVFVGNRPAWRLGCETSPLPLCERLQLDHRPVRLVGEPPAHCVQLRNRGDQLLRRLAMPRPLWCLEAQLVQPAQHSRLRRWNRRSAFHVAK